MPPDALVINNTPWERYDDIWVKREDLCCPGGPDFSKIRGLVAHLQDYEGTVIGILDTVHSKAGWGVAWICRELGLTCYNFYPTYKGETGLRLNQQKSEELGARLIPLPAGRSAILFHQARRQLSEMTNGEGVMLPNGLQLDESIEATYKEALGQCPPDSLGGTWVVSASTGTIATGVARALKELDPSTQLIVHMGYSHSQQRLRERVGPEPIIVDEGYAYKDATDYPCPFPCNPYYDLKAWKWLQENRQRLGSPLAFWNIGS